MTESQLRKPVFVKIENLEPQSRSVNLKVRTDVVKVVFEKTRPQGTRVVIAEVLVGDDTGSILLTLRNEQIDLVKENSVVILRNAKVEMFKGYMRIVVDKWGKLSQPEDESDFNFELNKDPARNLSLTEYELVLVG